MRSLQHFAARFNAFHVYSRRLNVMESSASSRIATSNKNHLWKPEFNSSYIAINFPRLQWSDEGFEDWLSICHNDVKVKNEKEIT